MAEKIFHRCIIPSVSLTGHGLREPPLFYHQLVVGMYVCKAGHMTIISTEHKDQETFQNSEGFKSKEKSRYKIEEKNSQLKHRHGYDISTSASLFGMQILGEMALFAVNLKRIRTLMKESD